MGEVKKMLFFITRLRLSHEVHIQHCKKVRTSRVTTRITKIGCRACKPSVRGKKMEYRKVSNSTNGKTKNKQKPHNFQKFISFV